MTKEQERALQAAEGVEVSQPSQPVVENEATKAIYKEVFDNIDKSTSTGEQADDEVTNNDGSIIETLDTAFHNQPGRIEDHSIAGSNRADYYEAVSQGKSDTEEEQDFLKNQHKE